MYDYVWGPTGHVAQNKTAGLWSSGKSYHKVKHYRSKVPETIDHKVRLYVILKGNESQRFGDMGLIELIKRYNFQ